MGEVLDVWTFTVSRENIEKQFIVAVYSCQFEGEKIKKSFEHTEVGWFALEEVDNLNMREGYKKAIAKVL